MIAVLEASSVDTSDGAGRWSRKTENIETDDEPSHRGVFQAGHGAER